MKPTDFKESNITLTSTDALTDLECKDLKVHRNNNQCISLWKPSIRERISILFHGNVWLCVHGQTQPPIWIDAQKTVFTQPSIRVRVANGIERIVNFLSRKAR